MAAPTGLGYDIRTQRYRDTTTGRFTKFVPNHNTINNVLTITPAMQANLFGHANNIIREAKQIARQDAYQSGDYYRSLRAAVGIDKAPGSRKAAVARANAFDWKSHWIEWGTSRGFLPRHVLTRAADQAGYATSGAQRNFRRIAAGGRGVWSSRLRYETP